MTSPLSSSSSPRKTRSSVLLPAPLRPTNPTLTLSLMVASALSSKTCSPYLLHTLVICSKLAIGNQFLGTWKKKLGQRMNKAKTNPNPPAEGSNGAEKSNKGGPANAAIVNSLGRRRAWEPPTENYGDSVAATRALTNALR